MKRQFIPLDTFHHLGLTYSAPDGVNVRGAVESALSCLLAYAYDPKDLYALHAHQIIVYDSDSFRSGGGEQVSGAYSEKTKKIRVGRDMLALCGCLAQVLACEVDGVEGFWGDEDFARREAIESANAVYIKDMT